MTKDELVPAMALCHVEFIIIHPFRDGNGRLGRLLTTVMALQASMPALDFEQIEKDKGVTLKPSMPAMQVTMCL